MTAPTPPDGRTFGGLLDPAAAEQVAAAVAAVREAHPGLPLEVRVGVGRSVLILAAGHAYRVTGVVPG